MNDSLVPKAAAAHEPAAPETAPAVEPASTVAPGAVHPETPAPVPPPGSRGHYKPGSADVVEKGRKPYLLFQLFAAEGQTLFQGEANKFNSLGKKYLELSAASANHLRRQFAAQGLLTVQKQGRRESYTLTPQGRLALGATASFYPGGEIRISGALLNDLLEAAREAATEFKAPPPGERAAERSEKLADALMQAFEELYREKHQRSGLVPIHEIRDIIRAKYGDKAASHGALDEAIRDLWRAKKVRLTPISDLSSATAAQLDDSLQGVGETLFYLEHAHEHAVL